MIDFYDLARSGTAPEASKGKHSQVAGTSFSARPKTRSVDNDVLDFNIDLRTNKPSYQQLHEEDEDYYGRGEFGHSEDLLQQAIESFQADLEDWTGRKDYDMPVPNIPNRQSASSAGRRSSKDGRKLGHSSAVSAYTQNVPQIVLQTSRKATKSQASSPRTQREPKTDIRADIRAVYGADALDRSIPSQRPKSQKPHSQTHGTGGPGTNSNKASDDAISVARSRDYDAQDYTGDHEVNDYDNNDPRDPQQQQQQRSFPGRATRSTSASRLRANISNQQQQPQQLQQTPGPVHSLTTAPTVTNASAAAPVKPFSVRKAAPSSSTAPTTTPTTTTSATQPRQASVSRPFSHSEARPSSMSSQGSNQGSSNSSGARPTASLDTPTSSSSSKRVVRKAPVSAVNPLLKSSLAPHKSRAEELASQASDDIDSDHTGESSLHVPVGYETQQSKGARGYSGKSGSSGAPSAMETFVKERASTANAKAPSTHKAGYSSGSGIGGPGANAGFTYSQSAGTAGSGGLTGTRKPPSESSTGGGSHQGQGVPIISSSSGSGKNSHSRVKETATFSSSSGRGYSRSPTMDGLSLGRPDSDALLVDFIQDSDIMEESFEESPILAAYFQQKSNAAHHQPLPHKSQGQQQQHPQGLSLHIPTSNNEGGEGTRSDGSTRPQSRKLYLGADKEGAAAAGSPAGVKSYKTAPRSAGARYGAHDSPAAAPINESGSPVALRKMSSFNELMPASRKWSEPSSQLPDNRPPSRQSSAFPVHLADEPPSTSGGAGTTRSAADGIPSSSTVVMTKASKISSPTNRSSVVPTPSKVSSMRWHKGDNDNDDEDDDDVEPEEPYEEDIPVLADVPPRRSRLQQHQHKDCEVDSNPNSELDSPRGGRLSHKGMLGGAGGGIFSTLSGSGGNSVHTSISNASAVSPPAQATTTTSSTAVHIAGSVAGGVAPTREHIGIARAPSGLSEEPSADDIPTYELQRPPSRQKFAAPQHLFEGMPPPTRVGTEKETSRGGKANNSSGGGGGESRRGLSSSPSQLEDFPSSRSTTARGGGGSSSNAALAPKYNPRDDGFADLDAGDAPFVIKLNSSVDTPPDKYSLYGDDGGGGGESVMHGQNRHHRRSYNSLTANQLAQSGHHSRSSSNASSNHWDHASAAGATEVDGIMSPLGYRPQTVGHAGPVKGARLPGVYPPVGAGTSSYSAPVTPVLPPARGKSAGESLRPQPGLSGLVRREGNNFLVMNQQPHAPLQQQPPTMPGHSRAGAYTVRELKGAPAAAGSGMGEYTAGPAVGRSGGWTESDSLRNLRLLNGKDILSPGYEGSGAGAYGLAPSSSSHALQQQQHQQLAQRRSTSQSPGNRSDEGEDGDDMTILTEDSGRHNMEGGMSMHSLALDSSLGEDFLSLFAPGP